MASALLLALLPAAAQAAPPPATAARAGETVESILEDQRRHGFASPRLALDRLRAASDVPTADAPLDLRRRYYGRVSYLADTSARPELAREARARLEHMAGSEGCLPCRAELLISRALKAAGDGRGDEALEYLAEADKLIPATQKQMRLELAYAEVFALDAGGTRSEAIARAVSAIRLAEQLGSTGVRIRLMIVLIGLNADLGYLDRAMAIADDAMALAEPLDYLGATSLIWLNRGHIHSLNGDRERQLHALGEALRIAGDVPGLEETEVISRSNLADYYLYRQDYPAALAQAERAIALARRIGYERGLIVGLANAGIALSHLGQPDRGIAMLRESIDMAHRIDHKVYVAGITHELVKVLEQAGRYREALQAMHEVAAVNREITREEREQAVLEVQERYASERKTREIERLSAENRAKQAEIEARTWRVWLWAVLAIAFALAATLLVQWLSRSRRVNRHLQHANASLAEETIHDPLTRTFNRRHFDRMMAGLAAPDATIGLMVLDLDRFKQVNDDHGHDVGDAVLVEVARRLSALLREQDAVVRWGGEEFVLVLPGTSAEGLVVLAERVLRAVGGAPVRTRAGRVPVTASIGAVTHPLRTGDAWEDAFRLADAAMYLAKQCGRNRAVCITDIDPASRPAHAAVDLQAAERRAELGLVRVEGPPVATGMPAACLESANG